MDMARTSVNLLGNCMATAVVARWEGVDFATEPRPVMTDGHASVQAPRVAGD